MAANFINFVTTLIYGNLGGGAKNHLDWTLDRLAALPSTTTRGDQFLAHHLDVILNRYAAWRSANFLPPMRPWNGTDIFPHPGAAPVGSPLPASLNGSPFPVAWTTNDLGIAVETYYNNVPNYSNALRTTEMDDEIKALWSYRYWAFMKWISDLRKRLLGDPVFPVPIIYDRDGTIL